MVLITKIDFREECDENFFEQIYLSRYIKGVLTFCSRVSRFHD